MTYRLNFNKFSDHLEEKSSGEIEVTFQDSTGATFAPKTVNWTLTDIAGTTTFATGSETPSAVVNILLYGDHLELTSGFSGEAEERRLLVEATYDKGEVLDVPLRDSCRFYVKNLAAVT